MTNELNQTPSSEPAGDDQTPSATSTLTPKSQSVISVLLVIHLFAIAICFGTVLPTSDLGARLLSVFAPYLRMGHFDLDYTPYYHVRESLNNDTLDFYAEREYVVDYLPAGADQSDPDAWLSMGEELGALPSSNQRQQRYFSTVGYFVDEDAEISLFVRDAVNFLIERCEQRPVKIRIRQHKPVPRERYYAPSNAQPDPDAPLFYQTRYTARVVYGEAGTVNIMKDVPASEAALIRN